MSRIPIVREEPNRNLKLEEIWNGLDYELEKIELHKHDGTD